ncbi:unnamed protein product [Leptidea sinapis]|uniref:Uncharacterized protein n=1 Tax=Leptidea sinapis TaxID=189913 RepID=A0A5E4QSU5_9NEOP|nr:unnamed protein product [Leptidea sinapis]
MNTANSGLSAGEKIAFWFYNKLKLWSKKWFTHLFLTLCLLVYSILGALMFQALEKWKVKSSCPRSSTLSNAQDVLRDLVMGLFWDEISLWHSVSDRFFKALFIANFVKCCSYEVQICMHLSKP